MDADLSSLEDKASLIVGASHWKSHALSEGADTGLVFSDGPHGLRKQEGKEDHLGIAESRSATCFPTASALACSFDPALVERVGAALGKEAKKQHVHVVLGPGVNIKRHPLCGRNFEYYSEDPVVSSVLGSAMVRGLQSAGVAACLKHFAANNQEHARMVSDSVIDERALRELYLAPFERIVHDANPWSVMTAYNRLNGVYCSEHLWLLRDVLRGEWGYDGTIISDWGAMSASVDSVRAGLDLCMPGPRPDHIESITRAVWRGELDEASLDQCVNHLRLLYNRTHQNTHEDGTRRPSRTHQAVAMDQSPQESRADNNSLADDYNEWGITDEENFYRSHADIARLAAAQSAVLLENNGILPINTSNTIAVIGSFARMPRYQGSGSSRINPKFLDNIWYRIEQRGFKATYADGYEPLMGETTEDQLHAAESIAERADVTIVVAGLPDRYESEGFDRKRMIMPHGHVLLIERVCAANPNTIVVLQGGAPMEMPWRKKPAAILLMYLSGCQGGGAAVDILSGDVNPSGKLAETWPERLEDTALGSTYPDMNREVHYRESLYVGYRYYDAVGIEPAYPFGHGLSYTSFLYAGLEASYMAETIDGENPSPTLTVSFDITNTGAAAGSEVAQIYIAPKPGVVPAPCPPQKLVSFTKIPLNPGETHSTRVTLDWVALRHWDSQSHSWKIYPGVYEVRVGASSRDIRLRSNIQVDASTCDNASARLAINTTTAKMNVVGGLDNTEAVSTCAADEIYTLPANGCFRTQKAERAFIELYGRPLPEPKPITPFTIDSTVRDMGVCWLGRRTFRIIDRILAEPSKKLDRIQREMMREMASNMPLRALTTSGVPLSAIEGFVSMLNGHYLTGLIRALRGLVHQRERHERIPTERVP